MYDKVSCSVKHCDASVPLRIDWHANIRGIHAQAGLRCRRMMACNLSTSQDHLQACLLARLPDPHVDQRRPDSCYMVCRGRKIGTIIDKSCNGADDPSLQPHHDAQAEGLALPRISKKPALLSFPSA